MANPSNEPNNRPIIAAAQGIYEVFQRVDTSAIPGNWIEPGNRVELDDRVFYYSYATGAFSPTAGSVVSCALWVDSHQSGILAAASTASGAFTISITAPAAAALTANQYAEGYFGVAASTGAGYLYRIRSHGSGTAGVSVILYDSLQHNITAGSAYFMVPNLYKDIGQASRLLGIPIGVACGTSIDALGNNFGGGGMWLQTFGPCNARHSGASSPGVALTLGTGGRVANMLVSSTAVDNVMFQIGKNSPLAATASQGNPVWLNIRY